MSRIKYDKLGVTVYCLTFNHEKYIKKTLDGFLLQKTSFPVKFIIHDDASTDNTAKIIREYEKNFPDKFSVIIEKQNMYSKNINIFNCFIMPLVDTKYIASCEGDDFWTDSRKLQIQFEYMESHPDCSFCVHNTIIVNENGKVTKRTFNSNKTEQDYNVSDIVRAKGGGLFHTSSFFYKSNDRANMPEEFRIRGIGDYNLSIYLSLLGNVHYFPEIMSCYRTGSLNSWIKQNMHGEKGIKFNNKLINWLETINEKTNFAYDDAFKNAIISYKFDNYNLNKDFDSLIREKDVYRFYKSLSFTRRLKFRLSCLKRKIFSH